MVCLCCGFLLASTGRAICERCADADCRIGTRCRIASVAYRRDIPRNYEDM